MRFRVTHLLIAMIGVAIVFSYPPHVRGDIIFVVACLILLGVVEKHRNNYRKKNEKNQI